MLRKPMNKNKKTLPLPIFDTAEFIENNGTIDYLSKDYCRKDIDQAFKFLKSYK